ncbi:MAG TPA: 2,3-epoxybenzoyl-CoA dihydrolase [Stellaceae bacterium]|nr:2,3-epoxybenzoyl-CoA dihydrolase [Stellaceae bacterium]
MPGRGTGFYGLFERLREGQYGRKARPGDGGIAMITFDTDPGRWRHWRLHCEGAVATLVLDVAEEGGVRPDYRLKLNSYDLGVDIELLDALDRIRFEHPQVRVVVVTGGKERVFCSGANIYMLAQASHAEKVDFCRFTNETRNAIEDISRHGGIKFIAAVNGACAGGGYELALACDEILMVDDRSTTLSLPEVALLGVLPGTGGLTRLTDKRKVRRDLADVFATSAEGVRADRALAWKLVDHIAPPAGFAALVAARARALAADSDHPTEVEGIALPPLDRRGEAEGWRYRRVAVRLARAERRATITVTGPERADVPDGLAGILAAGANWWPLAVARELDDALLLLRANEHEIGTLILETRGDPALVLAGDAVIAAHRDHWFVRAALGVLRRSLRRLDLCGKSLVALVDEGSCFAGSLFELALAADRSYMLMGGEAPSAIALGPLQFGGLEMANGRTRLETRFNDEAAAAALAPSEGRLLDAAAAQQLGLVTFAPDELDWADEIRLALEERASLSPDALAGLEANLRFAGPETLATRIAGRLSAWQNWVFLRPNAAGAEGALKSYGSGKRPRFDWERI